jgi:hypothetical protein
MTTAPERVCERTVLRGAGMSWGQAVSEPVVANDVCTIKSLTCLVCMCNLIVREAEAVDRGSLLEAIVGKSAKRLSGLRICITHHRLWLSVTIGIPVTYHHDHPPLEVQLVVANDDTQDAWALAAVADP